LFVSRRVQLATLAARHVVPAIYPFREDAVATFKDGNDLAAGRAQQGLGSSERKAELVVPGIAN
jgi:hypothetical protein